MKYQIATLLAASLIAGSAFAQGTTTTKSPLQGTADAPLKAGAAIEPAGAAEGRTPTSINTPQTGPAMASPKGEINKGVVSTPAQAQGSTSTATENVLKQDNKVQHPAAPLDGQGRMTDKMAMDKNVDKAKSPVSLTTPAPGTSGTTAEGSTAGGVPATRR